MVNLMVCRQLHMLIFAGKWFNAYAMIGILNSSLVTASSIETLFGTLFDMQLDNNMVCSRSPHPQYAQLSLLMAGTKGKIRL